MENFTMPVSTDTKEKIKQGLDDAFSALNKKPTTDCDWIFDDCKEMILEAVKNGISLSRIVEVIKQAGRYSTTSNGTKKALKITSQKLDKWLKGQGFKRRVHRRAKRPKAS